MVTTDLGACEWFVWDLRRSNLIDRGQLDQVIGEFLEKNPRAEPPSLADYLVARGVLTPFQAERLLQGKTQGFVLGPFTLTDALGSGSMGTVYKAQSKNDNRWYAVKVLPRRSMWNVRIARRKVRAFEQCQHPSVVPFVDVGTSGGMHYLVWALVEGEGLDKLVERQGKLEPSLAALYALQVAEGLEVCHEQGLFHGLIKPSNILLGASQQIHILDFGIGCLLAETEGESLVDTMSTANSVASGLDCASPESIMDPTNLTPPGDQYSLGCTLYFCLTGQYPFPDGSAAEKMMAHQTKEPTPIKRLAPDVPDALVAVVERLMQKAPEARFPSAQDVVDALKPFAAPRTWIGSSAARPSRHGESAAPRGHAGPTLGDTPQPAQRLQQAAVARPAQAPVLPNRHTVRETPAAPGNRPNSVAVAADQPNAPRQTLGERIGVFGIVLAAILACGLAWLLTYFVF